MSATTGYNKKIYLLHHLEEVRRRFFICLVSVILLSFVSYFFYEKVFNILTEPFNKPLVFLAPQEAFFIALKISVFTGLILSLPVIFYQTWKFVSLGLKKKETRFLRLVTTISVLLFSIGVVFAYFVVLPLGLKFLIGFGSGLLQPMISISNYISFVVTLLFAFGVVFELPLVILFLTRTGIVSHEFFFSKRKHAILLVFIVAAILTPPDVFTQFLMAGPLIVLYEISIWIARFTSGRKWKNEAKRAY